MNPLSKFIVWLQSKLPRWYTSNSWLIEVSIGAAGALLACWKFGPALGAIAFNAASYAYERWVDPHRAELGHKPIDDIGQRAAGSLLVAWLWSLLS